MPKSLRNRVSLVLIQEKNKRKNYKEWEKKNMREEGEMGFDKKENNKKEYRI